MGHKGAYHFTLKVRGDSMTGAEINDGNIERINGKTGFVGDIPFAGEEADIQGPFGVLEFMLERFVVVIQACLAGSDQFRHHTA